MSRESVFSSIPPESQWPERRFVPLIVLIIFLAIALLFWSTRRINAWMRADLANSIETVLKTTQEGLRIWIHELDANIGSFAQSEHNRRTIERIIEKREKSSPKLQDELRRELIPQLKRHGYLGYAVIAPDGRQIAPSPDSEKDARLLFRLAPKPLEKALSGKVSLGEPFFLHKASRVTMIGAAPVKNARGKVIAALVIYVNPLGSFTQMTQIGRLGVTGETYAVDKEGKMLTQSRFVEQLQQIGLLPAGENGAYQIELRDPGQNMLEGFKPRTDRAALPYTEMAQSVIAGHSGINLDGYRDYRGVEVVGAWVWDEKLGFGLATEENKGEAYQPFYMVQRITWIGILFMTLAGITILSIFRVEARMRQISDANAAANRARQDLLAIVSHDLKNPLASILITNDLLLKTLPPGESMERRRKFLETMHRSAEQMRRLVNDLHISARLEVGKLTIKRKNIDVEASVRQAVSMLDPLAKEKRIEIKSDIASGLPELWADEERLFQVFSNLVGNALKFTPEGGVVSVRAARFEDKIRFSVEDTGPGLAPEAVSRIFEKYWQAKETANKGMGLGLSIAKEIVEAHDGVIWAESVVGRGTSFVFTIPVARGIKPLSS